MTSFDSEVVSSVPVVWNAHTRYRYDNGCSMNQYTRNNNFKIITLVILTRGKEEAICFKLNAQLTHRRNQHTYGLLTSRSEWLNHLCCDPTLHLNEFYQFRQFTTDVNDLCVHFVKRDRHDELVSELSNHSPMLLGFVVSVSL